VVFNYDRNTVIKVAKNMAGIKQNTVEAKVRDFDDICAKIIDYDEGFGCVLMEKLLPITPTEFLNYFKVTKGEIVTLLDYHYFKSVFPNSATLEMIKNRIINHLGGIASFDNSFNNKTLSRVIQLMTKHKLEGGDLSTHRAWGKNDYGELRLLDYGLDNDVWTKNYKRIEKKIVRNGEKVLIQKCIVLS